MSEEKETTREGKKTSGTDKKKSLETLPKISSGEEVKEERIRGEKEITSIDKDKSGSSTGEKEGSGAGMVKEPSTQKDPGNGTAPVEAPPSEIEKDHQVEKKDVPSEGKLKEKEVASSEDKKDKKKDEKKVMPSEDRKEEKDAPTEDKKEDKKEDEKKVMPSEDRKEKKDAPTEDKKEEKKENKDAPSEGKKEGKKVVSSKDGKEEKKKQKPEFAPFEPEDPLKDVTLGTRKEIVEALVKKHNDMQSRYKIELEDKSRKPEELTDVKKEEKVIRDSVNEEVQKLKGKRKTLRDRNKELRSEFFDLLNKEEKVRHHQKEINMYSQFSKDLEWKLETEAITIENERRLLDELRETMNKMRAISDGLTPEEIKTRLSEIQEDMGSNLIRIEEYHRAMLDKVEESQTHHEKFIDARKQIREKEGREGWLKRRIELHKEMETFWMGQRETAVRLDDEDSRRDIENIQEAMITLFKARDGGKGDQGKDNGRGARKDHRRGPSRKLEMPEKDRKDDEKEKAENKGSSLGKEPAPQKVQEAKKEKGEPKETFPDKKEVPDKKVEVAPEVIKEEKKETLPDKKEVSDKKVEVAPEVIKEEK
ncbi:MAG: hypothetical protein U9R75_12540, partial [Candidatus Thermoplasmatota archaeon]|nr:hypothetical protein [Candidatus Thermoplasmatota archaeon]